MNLILFSAKIADNSGIAVDLIIPATSKRINFIISCQVSSRVLLGLKKQKQYRDIWYCNWQL